MEHELKSIKEGCIIEQILVNFKNYFEIKKYLDGKSLNSSVIETSLYSWLADFVDDSSSCELVKIARILCYTDDAKEDYIETGVLDSYLMHVMSESIKNLLVNKNIRKFSFQSVPLISTTREEEKTFLKIRSTFFIN